MINPWKQTHVPIMNTHSATHYNIQLMNRKSTLSATQYTIQLKNKKNTSTTMNKDNQEYLTTNKDLSADLP